MKEMKKLIIIGVTMVFLILNCVAMLYFFDLYFKYSSDLNVPTLPGETNILVAAEGETITVYDALWHGLLLASAAIGWAILLVLSTISAERIWDKRVALSSTLITIILCSIRGVLVHDIAGWIIVGILYSFPFSLIGIYLHLTQGSSQPGISSMVS